MDNENTEITIETDNNFTNDDTESKEKESNTLFNDSENNAEKQDSTNYMDFEKMKQSLTDEIVKNILNTLSDKKENSLQELKEYFVGKNENNSNNFQISATNENFSGEDKEEFLKINPDISSDELDKLLSSDGFKKFLSFKKGKNLNETYKNYLDYQTQIDVIATQKANAMYLKRFSSPGSMQSSGLTKILTWDTMNDDDFERAISDAKKGYYSKK